MSFHISKKMTNFEAFTLCHFIKHKPLISEERYLGFLYPETNYLFSTKFLPKQFVLLIY